MLLTQCKVPQLCMELSTTGPDTSQETSTLPLDHIAPLCKPIKDKHFLYISMQRQAYWIFNRI